MVCPQGERFAVKVLDFGLAKATREATNDTSLTHHGAMMGTPDYVAPEQAADARNADIRADIYSLGCTLYHLLSGRPPFPSPSLYETLQGHAAAKAKPLDLLQTDVPPALAGVVARMMAKDPAARYQTPQEVADALAPFVFPAHSVASPWGESCDGPDVSTAGPSCSRSRHGRARSGRRAFYRAYASGPKDGRRNAEQITC